MKFRILVGCLALSVGLVGCTKEPATPTPPTPSDPPAKTDAPVTPAPKKQEEPKKTPAPTEFKLTVEQFAADSGKTWQENIRKFGRKPITLTGEIRRISTNIAHAAFLEFKVDGSPNGIVCYTQDPKPWNHVLPGQKVTVTGYYPPEFGFGHTLQKAKIIEMGPKPDSTLDAVKFAKDCGADPEGMQRRYKNKNLILRGKVAAFAVDNFGTADVVLQGPAQPMLKIMCQQFELFSGKPLNVGDEVTLLVDCDYIRQELAYFTFGKVLQP